MVEAATRAAVTATRRPSSKLRGFEANPGQLNGYGSTKRLLEPSWSVVFVVKVKAHAVARQRINQDFERVFQLDDARHRLKLA